MLGQGLIFISLAFVAHALEIPISCAVSHNEQTEIFPHGTIDIPEMTFRPSDSQIDWSNLSHSDFVQCGVYEDSTNTWLAGASKYKIDEIKTLPKVPRDHYIILCDSSESNEIAKFTQVVHSFDFSSDSESAVVEQLHPSSPIPILTTAVRKKGSRPSKPQKEKQGNKQGSKTEESPNVDEDELESEPEEKTFFQKYGLYLIPILFLIIMSGNNANQQAANTAK
ncbi:Peroxisomal membrane protein Pex22 [Schizosaccharomyces pombe]|uniref:Uncharacterized protein C19D5.02c n=1 Tax=Schizosaccharomyces pombe (strain 972 / ATCC 24843) TaxID=284812 RepID=YFS2_SCHPO|nr:putative protein Pex22 [Schizosaccharomyces pombe]Q1K9B6.1 RecName: Full=Uncharacterized protein C19D5.02c; Flags: Precursor [Schizosaccharomyces pombe 972h-]CAB16712.1 peroxisomal membrane protein Pex22 (predicted) [Schizosaccharomyces pombe]|eukprot:NP_594900.1 putative protein Pex22 [Schizosaccharomyces pombe]